MKRLITAIKKRPIITSAFILAVVFTVLFAVRSVVFMVYWANPDHQDRAIEGWMTPRYIARSWHLPPEVMATAIGTDTMPDKRKALRDIAAAQGMTLADLQKRIADAAAEFRANQE